MLRTPNLIVPISLQQSFTDGPPSGRAWRVKDILLNTWDNRFIDVTIDRRVVGRWADDWRTYGSHLGSRTNAWGVPSLPSYLYRKGLWPGYPVAEGQSITLTNTVGASFSGQIIVDEYDAGDIRRDDVNGSDSSDMVYISYGHTGASINAAGEYKYNTSWMPTGFSGFPFGYVVASGYRAEVLGLMFSSRMLYGTLETNWTYVYGYKFMSQREVLFVKDRTFIRCDMPAPQIASTFYIGMDIGPSGDFTHLSLKEPWLFDTPMVFNEGDDLTIYGEVAVAGTAPPLTTWEQFIAAIVRMKKR